MKMAPSTASQALARMVFFVAAAALGLAAAHQDELAEIPI